MQIASGTLYARPNAQTRPTAPRMEREPATTAPDLNKPLTPAAGCLGGSPLGVLNPPLLFPFQSKVIPTTYTRGKEVAPKAS